MLSSQAMFSEKQTDGPTDRDRQTPDNPFPYNDTFRRPWETRLLKALWEKEKFLVTSNFSFSHSVFYPFG